MKSFFRVADLFVYMLFCMVLNFTVIFWLCCFIAQLYETKEKYQLLIKKPFSGWQKPFIKDFPIYFGIIVKQFEIGFYQRNFLSIDTSCVNYNGIGRPFLPACRG